MEESSNIGNLILWKLNEMMARRRVRNKDLAQVLGVSENSVYRLRKRDTMPRLNPEILNGICAKLDCQPADLLVYISDENLEKAIAVSQTNEV
ncbi:helix-turn-helix domain-containing protein [Planktothrix sp. FACHB-1355]|uniref:Helix-turn-helix domain-containing protein n=2 Tax=Cyanophyceae TaxID=3028117 RepID=A0A926ZFE9_9CYAN|nr:helix-turn-helix domain-containing protein [Aerosakkonema funiforme FACHB-1375]MBD3557631.1 helix-turn-helix domain-containing protein [Planktothrix sp. FACHB-1355]